MAASNPLHGHRVGAGDDGFLRGPGIDRCLDLAGHLGCRDDRLVLQVAAALRKKLWSSSWMAVAPARSKIRTVRWTLRALP